MENIPEKEIARKAIKSMIETYVCIFIIALIFGIISITIYSFGLLLGADLDNLIKFSLIVPVIFIVHFLWFCKKCNEEYIKLKISIKDEED